METKCIEWKDAGLAKDALLKGEVVLFPTETVYGIAAIPTNGGAVDALRKAKGRPDNKPFTLMCSSLAQVVQYCEVNAGISEAMKRFMPGQVTFLLRGRKGIPPLIDLGTGVVGVRVPDSQEVLSLIESIGSPLLVSSANRSGMAPALNFGQAKEIFGGHVPLIIEGDCVSDVPSTIVDFTKEEPKLIRQGTVGFEEILHAFNEGKKTIAIGSDHGGFLYKEAIVKHLKESGYSVLDCGCPSTSSVDYPLYGKEVGRLVADKKAEFGVVVCTSGIGISIAANKVPGIRCGLAYDDVVTGKMREHNDANVIAFGQKYMTLEDVLRRLDIFLTEKFSLEEKHHRRVDEIE